MKKMDGKFKISLLFLAVILIIPVIGPHLIRHDPYAVNAEPAPTKLTIKFYSPFTIIKE